MMRATQLISLVGFVSASHFRYGTIAWEPTGGNSVRLKTDTAWRRSYWDTNNAPGASGIAGDNYIAAGDTFVVPQGAKGNKFYFGDTTAGGDESFVRLSVTCTSPSSANDYNYRIDNAMGKSTEMHTYATGTNGADPWVAGFFGCCRLGARPDGDPNKNPGTAGDTTNADGLNNNGYRSWDIQTKITLTPGPNMANSSPFAVGRPILRLRMDFKEIFDIVAIDQEEDELTWRLGQGTEMGEAENKQPGYGTNKRRDGSDMIATNKVQMHNLEVISMMTGDIVRVGEMHWDTNGMQTGYWQSTVMVHTPGWSGVTGMNADGVRRTTGGTATIPYDFLIVLRDAKGNTPPFWIEPTPERTDEIKANCPGTVTYTMRANDNEKGQDPERMAADHLNIFLINVPPQGMSHTANGKGGDAIPQPAGLDAAKNQFNPIERVASWPVTCANAGKTVVCYQTEDFNLAQPLDSRVRCVIIKVVEVINSPPTFCGATPAEGAKIPVCVGKEVSFTVEVCDSDSSNTVTIDWISGVPSAAVTPKEEYDGGKNRAKRTFNLTPSQDIVEGTVCFRGTDNTQKESDKYTTTRCVLLSIRYPPRFIAPTPQLEEGASAITAKVCEETRFTVRAKDNNAEDDVRIFALEDPGIPNGAVVEQDVCPPPQLGAGEGAAAAGPVKVACNYVERLFRWSPVKSQGGKTYRVCFIARDNKDNCVQGGYFSLTTSCVDIAVLGANVEWAAGTPADEKNFNAYVGATLGFNVISQDANYAVAVTTDAKFPLPNGATLSQCVVAAPAPVAGGERRRTLLATQQCSRGFGWKPRRGQEAFSYRTCFHGSDNVCPDTVGHDAVVFSAAAHMSAVGPRCFNIHVIRCKYAVNEGDTLHYLSKYYHLDTNWLRIWNSNGNDDLDSATDTIHNPNTILHSEDILNVGPVYKVQAGDTMIALAARFHTTVKKIISVNPDLVVDESGGKLNTVLMPGQDLCVLPCTDTPHVHSNTYKYAY